MTASRDHVQAETQRALYPRLLVAAVIHLGIIAMQWGVWPRFAALCALFVVYAGVTVALARRWERETTTLVVVRLLVNAGLIVGAGHWSGWSVATWLYLPFSALARDSANFRALRLSCAGVILVVCAAAVIEHAASWVMVTFALMSVATYASAERRLRFTLGIMAQLRKAHADLAAMHERAVEQGKLSGLGMLAAGVAHEINNPISYVSVNLELLLGELRSRRLDPTLAEYTTDVLPATLDGVRRIAAIVGDLRRFARGDPEGMVEYDLNEQVRAALRIMNNKIVHRCDVELDLGALPPATGLPQQLVQVLINLLDNAVDAQPEEERGYIRIASAHDGGMLRVSVADRGAGMTPEVRARVFEPFYTTKGVGNGTGLGLSVAYGIVKAHGGSIDIESKPGAGSTFTVRLPVQPGLAKLAALEAA